MYDKTFIVQLVDIFAAQYERQKGLGFNNEHAKNLQAFADLLSADTNERVLTLAEWNDLGNIIYKLAIAPLPPIGGETSRKCIKDILKIANIETNNIERIQAACQILFDAGTSKKELIAWKGLIVFHAAPQNFARALVRLKQFINPNSLKFNEYLLLLVQCQEQPHVIVPLLEALHHKQDHSNDSVEEIFYKPIGEQLLNIEKKTHEKMFERVYTLASIFKNLALLHQLTRKNTSECLQYFDYITAPALRLKLTWLPHAQIQQTIETLINKCKLHESLTTSGQSTSLSGFFATSANASAQSPDTQNQHPASASDHIDYGHQR